ncbi:MAG: 5-(carboxyamino)imidazole ribonucleotide mutase [Gemmatimonadota bacterium]
MTSPPRILVIIGSESDRPVMEKGVALLQERGFEVEFIVSSAHRDPENTASLAVDAEARGFSIVICGAGLSAGLAGVVAAHTELPVIGVPISAGTLGGLDALLATVQLPSGVPVATVGIDNAKNAAILAARILRLAGHPGRGRERG